MTSRAIAVTLCSLFILHLMSMTMHAADDTPAAPAPAHVTTDIDWPAFLARHDLHWDALPTRWLDAPFLGNGMMGTMIFQTGDQAVRWQVGRGDVQDHRPLSQGGTMYARPRLPIGYFELETVGKITGGIMRLDLWNAEATGVITTDRGSIRWRSIVHTEHMAILTELEPDEGEAGCAWRWHAEEAASPRHTFKKDKRMAGYVPNPEPVESTQGDVNLCTQPLLAGGETVTAWAQDEVDGKRRLSISVAHTYPETAAAEQAIAVIEATRRTPMAGLVASHRAWWHAFYPESFVSIPDAYWEQFYWLQMYKLASATRADRMLLDLNGPWLQRTPWPGIWWNLNVQLTYWPTYASNRHHLGASLGNVMYDNVQNLIDTVPEAYRHDSAAVGGATPQDLSGGIRPPDGKRKTQMGLLLWGLHNCWLHYRHTMDDDTLREHLYPLLKRAVNFYFHFLTEDEAGGLHIPTTWSPEYKAGMGPDTNFDLALLRWGCTALIASADRLDIDDPLLPKWRDTLERLAPYPVNENGYMIAADVPFAVRHRHYSHLLMLYPLYLVNADQPDAEPLAIKSIEHWTSFSPWHGYAFTGSSSLYSAFGHGNDALDRLHGLREHVSKTTMYSEIGPWAQCIETPLSAAQSIHDMLLQSWGNTIRAFPAAPDAWADIAFHELSAEGGFTVSAAREAGVNQWVRITSRAGEPCRIKPNLPGEVKVTGPRAFKLEHLAAGVYTLDLDQGESALLYSADTAPLPSVGPVMTEEVNHRFRR